MTLLINASRQYVPEHTVAKLTQLTVAITKDSSSAVDAQQQKFGECSTTFAVCSVYSRRHVSNSG